MISKRNPEDFKPENLTYFDIAMLNYQDIIDQVVWYIDEIQILFADERAEAQKKPDQDALLTDFVSYIKKIEETDYLFKDIYTLCIDELCETCPDVDFLPNILKCLEASEKNKENEDPIQSKK
jgi:hypothetical protein